MKRFICVFTALVLMLCFSACGGVVSAGGVNRFLEEVDAGNYADAADIYSNSVLGNTEREYESEQALLGRLEAAVDEYNSGVKTLSETNNTVSTIDRVGVLSVAEVDEYIARIDALERSKAAFQSAENLFADGYYEDAITNYQAVVEEDANYTVAQQKADEAKDLIMSALGSSVDEQVELNAFEKALELVQNAALMFGDTAEVMALETEIKAKYLDYSLMQAESIFEAGKDYEGAIRVITAAINTLGEDVRLTAALEEYQSYIPVYLYDLEYFDTDSDAGSSFAWQGVGSYTEETDNYGNDYQYALSVDCQSGGFWAGSWASVRYHLGGEYTTFSGTCIVPYDDRDEDVSGYLEIYGDDVLLYRSPTMVADSYPEAFSVDVSGVAFLEIVFTPPATFECTPTLCNGILQK